MEKKIVEIRSRLVSYDGKFATFEMLDQVDEDKAQEIAVNGNFYAVIDFVDERNISIAQRNHFYALLGDITEKFGISKDDIEGMIKHSFKEEFNLDEVPSLQEKNMSRKMATDLIDFTVNWMIWNDVPFRKNMFYLTKDTNKILYALTMNRKCWVCGKPGSSIHHAKNLVGMGGDRTKFNHLDSKFMCLCESGRDLSDETKIQSHHQEAHILGLTKFMNKYHLGPIKLKAKDLKELGIRGNYEEE